MCQLASPTAEPNVASLADRRRARLEERINILENSFGNGAFRDGLIRDRIVQLQAELAALPVEVLP